MIEFFLFMVAAAVQSVGGDGGKQPGTEAGNTAKLNLSATQSQLVAETQEPSGRFTTATEVRPILGATRGNWVSVREFNGQDLVYVTHLWSWRCGLVQIRLAINGAPAEVWSLPPCHLDQTAPNAIVESDGLPFRAFDLGSVQRIDVEVVYDDLAVETASFGRHGLIPP